MMDRFAIREILENWVVWRDAGDWGRFRTLWHPEGRMSATWFLGGFEQFIAAAEASLAAGVTSHHYLCGSSIEISGSRAIAQTKMSAAQRIAMDGIVCDAVCFGRFYDFLEKRNEKWGILLRQPIYEKDRLDPVDGCKTLDLDQELLSLFPKAYCRLAYAQTKAGFDVNRNLPVLAGPVVEELYAHGAEWLAGRPLSR